MSKLELHLSCDIYEKVSEKVEELKNKTGFELIIAFSGGGNGLDDYFGEYNPELKNQVREFIDGRKKEIIEEIIKRLRDYKVAILTGGTKWDVPKIAVEMARKYGLPTIGVLPERGKKYSLGELLNLEIIIKPIYQESQFGDESSVFSKLADGIIMLGGGAGTLIEMAHVLKINEARLKHGERIKYIVPITGIPGMSERVSYMPISKKVRDIVFPDREIKTGEEAFEWLRQKLSLDDFLKENVF